MKHFWPDTIQSRTIIVLLIGLGVFHVLSLWTYQVGLRSEIDLTNENRLAERLVSIKRAILALPVDERDGIAHSLSGGPIEVHWSVVGLTATNAADDPELAALRSRLVEMAPELVGQRLIVAAPRAVGGHGVDPHQIQVSIRATDGGWVNFSVTRLSGPHGTSHGVFFSTTLMALGVVLVSVLMVRWLTRPLRIFGDAARQTFVGNQAAEVRVEGPKEVRDLAEAFNDMQRRIKRLIDDRTQTLAAVSHDLKTPLTRLRLRAAELDGHASVPEIEADLDEMEAMLDASLMFLRGEQVSEPVRDFDLSALLETIKDDFVDAGRAVALVAPPRLRVSGRHLSLKRAFTNLIWNAVRYGKQAHITLDLKDRDVLVVIDDDGPGIPQDQLEAVFAPFTRIETSRSRETGGVGLGLTIARTVLRGHGGDVELHNRRPRGLRAAVRLPVGIDS
ncbi:ATP-binding protein [Bosea vaviloviae]|uniref:histidine kinase n=1 Tax=Bosea vaviloviae TaxID=1526658 RepID=A0A1D7U4H9_9HYPH|nr:ATP-binding protein [Bosea vaviloviae]AOO82242.1 hypothetical protein BHK69_18940 [Bosea vaviloviae]